MFNDAMKPDSGTKKKKEKKERKKDKKKITAMCFLPRLARSTHISHRETWLIREAMFSGLLFVCWVPGPPLLSISVPRASLVSFLGRGDD